MTDIEQRAREVVSKWLGDDRFRCDDNLRTYIAAAIQSAVDDEREACAKTADSVIGTRRGEIAAAIRARSQKVLGNNTKVR